MFAKPILRLVFAIAASAVLIYVQPAEAVRSYLNEVNDICGTSDDCGICHVDPGGGGRLNTDGQAYSDAGHDPCYFCPDAPGCGGPSCNDGDNDGWNTDGGTCGPIDCDDTNPSINPGTMESCADGVDNDCDGLIDCDDPNCNGDAACPICTREGKGRSCSDNIDNDCDMLIDCEDADCAGNRACSPGKEGKGKTCSDNVDNDGDGAIDCADTDCASNRSCR